MADKRLRTLRHRRSHDASLSELTISLRIASFRQSCRQQECSFLAIAHKSGQRIEKTWDVQPTGQTLQREFLRANSRPGSTSTVNGGGRGRQGGTTLTGAVEPYTRRGDSRQGLHSLVKNRGARFCRKSGPCQRWPETGRSKTRFGHGGCWPSENFAAGGQCEGCETLRSARAWSLQPTVRRQAQSVRCGRSSATTPSEEKPRSNWKRS
jgi:hypothetical protein